MYAESIATYACYKGASGWSEQVVLYVARVRWFALLAVGLANNLHSFNYPPRSYRKTMLNNESHIFFFMLEINLVPFWMNLLFISSALLKLLIKGGSCKLHFSVILINQQTNNY